MKGLYAAKPWFVRRLHRIEDGLVARRVSPDALTLAAVAVSVCCGLLLALGGVFDKPALWLLVPPLGLVRLALNALDGSIARRSRSASPFGEVVNEMGDRISDVVVIGSLALVVTPSLALGALAITMLSSAAGLLGTVVIGERLSTGPMGKADRVVALGLGALVAGVSGSTVPLIVALWVVLAGAAITVTVRVLTLRNRTRERFDVR
ncbi:MAG: CDP-alcohol phosphatidyltransferase family protein [Actinomycetota bacterium]